MYMCLDTIGRFQSSYLTDGSIDLVYFKEISRVFWQWSRRYNSTSILIPYDGKQLFDKHPAVAFIQLSFTFWST